MTNKRYVSEFFFYRCLLRSLLVRLASLDAKNIDQFRSCTVSKISIFVPISIEIKVDTAARFVPSENKFCVIRCEQCTQRISSCKYVVLFFSVSYKMNFYDATPYFQEVGGVTYPLISYKL